MNPSPAAEACNTLYYDGQCPLCSKEMQRLGRLQDGDLRLVDIHRNPLPEGKTRAELLEVLHLCDANGEWMSGLDANVKAWQHTSWGWLFAWLRWPLIATIADRVYAIWARRRYQKLYGDGSGR